MGFVEVNGIDVHYIEAGEGPPLVFIHGFGGCAQGWYQQIEVFRDRFRVVAYDSVNHGHSMNSPAGDPEPDRADELEGVLDALAIERPILAGNSMGALTLLRWAVRHPDTARALIPSGMGIAPPDADPAAAAARTRAITAAIDEDVLFIPAEGAFTSSFPQERRAQYERYVRLRSTATRIEAAHHPRPATASNPSREELATRVADIRSPMHVVVGDRDWLFDAAKHLHATVPGSSIEVLPGAPHNAYFEVPEAYNSSVSAFLRDRDLMPA